MIPKLLRSFSRTASWGGGATQHHRLPDNHLQSGQSPGEQQRYTRDAQGALIVVVR